MYIPVVVVLLLREPWKEAVLCGCGTLSLCREEPDLWTDILLSSPSDGEWRGPSPCNLYHKYMRPEEISEKP